ncbi:PREDICTED: deleted in malignant brain tumors 1 protein-like [Tinamus guttatus]|uniref:deleted in malignant brain tumors 1 protein-like n=1 Tax=Tinamus guttatus TaxID=94827 RepID=UPI00052F3AE5|nr:PREDICTED: deleted in malignant brain tumors 1 protein-like [Tinamus guttatus]
MGIPGRLHRSSRYYWGRDQPICTRAKSAGILLLMTCLWGLASSSSPHVVDVRLVNGPSHCAGRVEVFYKATWGTVCDDNWGLSEGQVVCRQLGCGALVSISHGARYGEGTGRIWLDEVNCTGAEAALSQCEVKSWGEHNCQHAEDASVECADSGISELGPLQLLDGPNRCAGRVEVLHNHLWGTICDDNWDLADATVVCRQLGCGTALSATIGAHFGRGNHKIWLDEVNCTGTEASLFECQASAWGENNCFHGEDAGVICSDAIISETARLRLTNGSNSCAGRVEVLHNEEWGAVCDHGWDKRDAEVVCRQLGCGTVLSTSSEAHFGAEPLRTWLDYMSCTGSETALNKCRASPWGNSSCSHGKYATVVCSGSEVSNIAPVRLVDGPGRCAGRVEVLHNKKWGTVCDDSWDFLDAAVVCRQLDCGVVISAPWRAHFGHGQDPIWLDEVNCTGTEAALSECKAKDWGVHGCDHGEDASVVCSGSGISDLARLRLANGSTECSGRVEVFHDQRWGSVCDDGWSLTEARVVCRQLGCGPALSANRPSPSGDEASLIWVDAVECTGSEAALFECKVKLWGAQSCKSKGYASVTCSAATPSTADLQPTNSEVLRLVNGPNKCAGRVEVFHNQQWGTVCDDN